MHPRWTASRLVGPAPRRSRRVRRFIHGLLVLAALWPQPVTGQEGITARAAEIRFGGRLHTQLATSSAADGKSTDFFTRRARFTLDVSVSSLLDARVQPDFGGGRLELKDAYFRLNFDSGFRLWAGQFKRAFDLFELDSSTDIVVVERTGRIDGVGGCAGPGGTCALSRFTEKLGYSDRDIGIKADGSIGDRFTYMATLTNGTGTTGSDENSGKSLAGRVTLRLFDQLRLSGNVSRHDFVRGDGETDAATAFGADLEFGRFRGGMHLQVGVIGGANWRLEETSATGIPRFFTWQTILSRYFAVDGQGFEGIEPVARASWGDPNRDAGDDAGLLLTPGVFLYVKGKNRIGANVDVYRSGSGDTEFSFKLQTYLYY